MRSRYKFLNKTGLYFITNTTVGKVPVFKRREFCDVILRNLTFYREKDGLKIYYYVIMPEHVHMIVSCDTDISKIIQRYKSYTAKEIIGTLQQLEMSSYLEPFAFEKKEHKRRSKFQIWQEGSYPKLIEYDSVLKQKVDYIHQNPVKANYCREPEDWYYSSYRNIEGIDAPFQVDPINAFVPNEGVGNE